jgi:hypothetical protein
MSLEGDSDGRPGGLLRSGTTRAKLDAVRSIPLMVFVLAVFTATCPALSAQAPRPEPGARIRLYVPRLGERLTGTLVAWEFDTLVVSVDGDAQGLGLIVPVDSVTRIEVRRERPLTLEGAGVGLLGGALLALIASPDSVDENGDCTPLACLAYQVSPRLGTRVAVLGLVGAFAGAIAGSDEKTHTWIPVHVARLDVGPARSGGLALGVRISF